MSTVLFDLRDVVRGLRRDRLYAVTVIGTLALTLGASTAVFSIVDGVLLKPLAYRESQRLVSIREVVRDTSTPQRSLPANAHHFEEWRTQATSFAVDGGARFPDDEPHRRRRAGPVVHPARLRHAVRRARDPGRGGPGLTRDDEQPGRPAVARSVSGCGTTGSAAIPTSSGGA